MNTCSQCGSPVPPEHAYCENCGQRIQHDTPEAEVGHIEYLLREIPRWQLMGWIFKSMAERLTRHYQFRRAGLLGQPALDAPPNPAESPIWGILESTSAESKTFARTPHSPPQVSAPDSTQWISEFLEAHWLKLLAAIAAVFIFVGMRQVLGWEWVSTLAITMIPLLPIGLCGALYYFGMRARAENTLGAFVYQAVATVLCGFSLFAVNKHWLGGAIPESITLAGAVLTSTLMAAITYHLTDDNGFLHISLAGALASLNTMLRVAMPIPAHAADSAFVYCLANFILAGGSMAGAKFISPQSDDLRRRIALTWAHISFSAGLLWMSLPAAMHGGAPENAAILLFTVSGFYVLASQAFGSAGMGYVSGAFAAAAAAFLLNDLHSLDWYACGYSAITLAGLTLALSRIPVAESADTRRSPSEAYADLSLIYSFAAGIALCMRVVLSADGPAITGADWPAGALLGLLSALALAVHTSLRRIPVLTIASALPTLIGLTLSTDRVLAWTGIIPNHTLAHSLFPFVVVSGLTGISLIKRDNLRPYALQSLIVTDFACLAGIITAIGLGLQVGHIALWSALVAYAVVSVIFAQAVPMDRNPEYTKAAAFAAMACVVAMGGFAGETLFPGRGIEFSGLTLGLTGWALLGIQRYTSGDHWRIPLRVGAGAAGVLGGIFAFAGSGVHAEWIAIASGINLSLLLSISESSDTEPLTLLTGALAAVTTLRLTLIAPIPGILFALAAAGGFTLQSIGRKSEVAAWLAFGTSAVGGVIGAISSASNLPAAYLGVLAFLMASAWAFRSAGIWNRPEFTYAGSAAFLTGYAHLVWILFRPEGEWYPITLLPAFMALYAVGFALRERAEFALARPLRAFSTAVAALVSGHSFVLGISGNQPSQIPAVTLSLYGAAFLFRSGISPAVNWVALTTAVLESACGFWIAAWFDSPTEWAAVFGVVPLGMIFIAQTLRKRDEPQGCVYALAAFGAALTAGTALKWADLPGAGTHSVIALLEAGVAFASLAYLGRGLALMHAAFACWFAAYGLVLYDNLGINSGVLDLYSFPLAAYVLGLSYFAVKRGDSDAAAPLWWGGLIALFAPTYISFHHHYVTGGSPLHALLLLIECVGAIAWGIAHRIRAFVLTGTGFSLTFAITLASGIVVEIWTGVMAVAMGVTLLAFVFYVSLHQESIRIWMERFNREWNQWR